MFNFIAENYEWFFSGAGITILLILGKVVFKKTIEEKQKKYKTDNNSDNSNTNNQNTTINIGSSSMNINSPTSNKNNNPLDKNELKKKTKIMFIDDDGRFKVVSILKSNGWVNTSRVADIANLDDINIDATHIFFVDIQGVGKKLSFRDEGLGLAEAIKNKYNDKKVVIYSAQSEGERFHNALRKADEFLSKDADPYEFQQVTERLASEYWCGK